MGALTSMAPFSLSGVSFALNELLAHAETKKMAVSANNLMVTRRPQLNLF